MSDDYYEATHHGSFWRARGDQPFLYRTRARWLRRRVDEGLLLDIGSGEGYFLLRARRLGLPIIGMDLLDSGLLTTRQRDASCPLVRSEGCALPVRTAALAGITLWDVVEHLDDPDLLLSEARRALRPGGTLLVSTPNPIARSVGHRGAGSIQFSDATHVSILPAAEWSARIGAAGFAVDAVGGDAWWDPPYGTRWSGPAYKVLSQAMFALRPWWPISSAENTVIAATAA